MASARAEQIEKAQEPTGSRECSCLGFCKGREGLSSRYRCALDGKAGKVAALPPVQATTAEAWPHPCRSCGGFGGHHENCPGDCGASPLRETPDLARVRALLDTWKTASTNWYAASKRTDLGEIVSDRFQARHLEREQCLAELAAALEGAVTTKTDA